MRSQLRRLKEVYRYTYYFFKTYKPLEVAVLFRIYLKGIFPSNYILFGLKDKDIGDYVTDFEENFKVSRINKKAAVLNSKLLFSDLLPSTVRTPDIFALIIYGKIVPYRNSSMDGFEALLSLLSQKRSLIFKPIDDDGGEGIYKLSQSDTGLLWNQSPIADKILAVLLSQMDNYFISETIEQHVYSSNIFPDSVNTVRMLTMIDPKTKKSFIAACAHRIGNRISQPVDNCAKGGFTAYVDIKTGLIGKAVHTKFKGKEPVYYSSHPDTASPIEGVVVPHFEKLKGIAQQMHNSLSFVQYIGWDFVLGADDKWIVLEGNDSADLKLHQVHKPLLADPTVKAFYRYHNAISR